MPHEPRNLLVTGAAGFIGNNFVRGWLERHAEGQVVGLDALTYAGNRASLADVETNSRFRFVHADILNDDLIESILVEDRIDTIVHFAAESHVDRSILGPDAFLKTNIEGTHSLLKAARRVWLDSQESLAAHRFHHVSTDEVYGTLAPDAPAFTEQHPYQPNSPYAASKASSDHIVRSYHHTYGLNTTISNCSNNYGPYQFPEKLIPLIIANCLDGKPLPIYGDGKQIRDWLYVDDHNRGIECVLATGTPGETYNIGGNNEWTNLDIVHHICAIMDEEKPAHSPHEQLVEHVRDRPGHDRRYAINANKISSELGFAPAETFETGIRKTVQWYLQHESWWRAVMDGSYNAWISTQYESR